VIEYPCSEISKYEMMRVFVCGVQCLLLCVLVVVLRLR